MKVVAILVVCDHDNNRFTLVKRLKRAGYDTVTTANEGQKVSTLLAQSSFDLVVLDVMKLWLDGDAVLTAMKAAPILGVPVIMIGAANELDHVVRCIELEAEDYLPKPFSEVSLRARVRSVHGKEKPTCPRTCLLYRDRAATRTPQQSPARDLAGSSGG
jgi:DNA-binding response OmpR family regulator